MLPTDMDVAAQLRNQVYYMLDNDFLDNALFLASRLHALDPRGADAAHVFALCHLRLGKYKAAFDYAREKGSRGHHLGCAFVFARACLKLERYSEGLAALDKARGSWGGRNNWNQHSESSRRHWPDAAAVNSLMGKLAKGMGDINRAIDCHIEALRYNPFLWDSFVDLCDTGANIKTSNIFYLTPEISAIMSVSNGNGNPDSQMPYPYPNLQHSYPGNGNVMTPPTFDPFMTSHSLETKSSLGSDLFAKFNAVMPGSNANNQQRPEPRQSHAVEDNFDEDIVMGDAGASTALTNGIDYPQAPVRRARTLKSDITAEPPRMQPVTRSRIKQGPDVSDNEPTRSLAPPSLNHKRTVSGHAPPSSSSSVADANAAPQRRSVRLFNQIRPSSSRAAPAPVHEAEVGERGRELRKVKATGTKGRSGAVSTVGRVVSGNRKPLNLNDQQLKDSRTASIASGTAIPAPPSKSSISLQPTKQSREQEAVEWLLELFGKLGAGYYLLSRYQCGPALQAFASIPTAQRDTPWVLAQMGKAYYQRGGYSEAREIFAHIKKIAPSRMEDNEVYSTILWHLKAEMDLAYLSHELMDADRLSPQAWCALGNSFSLQREHDQAVKCFRRATQLDSRFSYAYTLQGHEHLENEEFDKALLAYRNAIAIDRRHYYGWYGLGKVYEKMEKYEIAEKHYKCAAAINPTNAALAAYIGVVLEKQRKPAAALVQYSRACELDSRSALSRFKKARVLMALRRPREALTELEVLKDIAPDEANVHFMLGRLYKMLKDRTAAIRHFTVALNLDPKASQYIKEQMESLDDDDDDDDLDDDD